LGDDSGAVLFADHPSRAAPGMEEAQYLLSRSAARGVRGFDLGSYDVKGVPMETLRRYGLTAELLDLIRHWKTASFGLDEAERARLDVFEHPTPEQRRIRGPHPFSKTLWRLEDDRITAWHAAGTKHFTPNWHTGQEHGVITPRLFVKTGEEIELDLPEELPPSAAMRIVGRVLPAFDRDNRDNIDLMSLIRPLADNQAAMEATSDGAMVLRQHNPSEAASWRTDFPQRPISGGLDLSRHRGIGMWVTGDGSKALLVLQLGAGNMRDYVVPIDFTGRRWIEIPCGEVAWRLRRWGWRSETGKFFRYDNVRSIAIGVGHVPAKTSCRVQVEGIRALAEVPATLVNPRLEVGGRNVTLSGTIPAGWHFIIRPDLSAATFDPNWKRGPVLEAKVSVQPTAEQTTVFSCRSSSSHSPWLEIGVQIQGNELSIQPNTERSE